MLGASMFDFDAGRIKVRKTQWGDWTVSLLNGHNKTCETLSWACQYNDLRDLQYVVGRAIEAIEYETKLQLLDRQSSIPRT